MSLELSGKAIKKIQLPTVNYADAPIIVTQAQTGDFGSRILEISLYDDNGNIDLNGYKQVMFTAMLPNGDIITSPKEKIEVNSETNSILVEFGGLFTSQAGNVTCDVLLANEDFSVCLNSRTFYVTVFESQSWEFMEVNEESYNILIKTLKEVQQAESERSSAESLRQSNEESRIEQENLRKTAETERKNAENLRQTNEDNRVNKEGLRETAETERKKNEEERKKAELERGNVFTQQMNEVDKMVNATLSAERLPNGSKPTIIKTETQDGLEFKVGVPDGAKGGGVYRATVTYPSYVSSIDIKYLRPYINSIAEINIGDTILFTNGDLAMVESKQGNNILALMNVGANIGGGDKSIILWEGNLKEQDAYSEVQDLADPSQVSGIINFPFNRILNVGDRIIIHFDYDHYNSEKKFRNKGLIEYVVGETQQMLMSDELPDISPEEDFIFGTANLCLTNVMEYKNTANITRLLSGDYTDTSIYTYKKSTFCGGISNIYNGEKYVDLMATISPEEAEYLRPMFRNGIVVSIGSFDPSNNKIWWKYNKEDEVGNEYTQLIYYELQKDGSIRFKLPEKYGDGLRTPVVFTKVELIPKE